MTFSLKYTWKMSGSWKINADNSGFSEVPTHFRAVTVDLYICLFSFGKDLYV